MTMRFLADGSCDFAVVRALRAAGFDVLCISESTPRAEDSVKQQGEKLAGSFATVQPGRIRISHVR
jgi:ribosomal protein S11